MVAFFLVVVNRSVGQSVGLAIQILIFGLSYSHTQRRQYLNMMHIHIYENHIQLNWNGITVYNFNSLNFKFAVLLVMLKALVCSIYFGFIKFLISINIFRFAHANINYTGWTLLFIYLLSLYIVSLRMTKSPAGYISYMLSVV